MFVVVIKQSDTRCLHGIVASSRQPGDCSNETDYMLLQCRHFEVVVVVVVKTLECGAW